MDRDSALSSCNPEELGNEHCRRWPRSLNRPCSLTNAVPKGLPNKWLFFNLWLCFRGNQHTVGPVSLYQCERIFLTHNKLDWGLDSPAPLSFKWNSETTWVEDWVPVVHMVIGNTHVGSFPCSSALVFFLCSLLSNLWLKVSPKQPWKLATSQQPQPFQEEK